MMSGPDTLGMVVQYVHSQWLWIYLAMLCASFTLGLLNLGPLHTKPDETDRALARRVLFRKIAYSVLTPVILYKIFFEYSGASTHPTIVELVTLVLIWGMGKSTNVIKSRYIDPHISAVWERWRIGQSGEAISDIRTEQDRYAPINYDPTQYYKDDSIFRGLDEQGNPIYSSILEWQSNNQALIGPTQFGKGVDIGLQLDQAIRMGACAIFVDPKPDKYARAIMNDACQHTGRKLIEIDLTGAWEMERYALLASGTSREKRERLLLACNLLDTGSGEDYYRSQERDELDTVIDRVGTQRFDRLLKQVRHSYSENEILSRTRSSLQEIARLPGIDDDGVNIEQALLDNAVIYIRSSTTDNTVKTITKMLIQDIVQTLFRTSPEQGGPRQHHVLIVVDEVRFLISNYLANALATVKGFNAHLLIAYQSIKDIKNIDDRNVDKDALFTSVQTNCTIKQVFQAADPETAENIAQSTGTVVKQVQDRKQITMNEWGGEEYEGQKMLTNVEENYITENQLYMLQERVAVLLRPGHLAQIIKNAWVNADPMRYQPTYRTTEPIKKQQITRPLKSKAGEQKNATMNEKLTKKKTKAKQKRKRQMTLDEAIENTRPHP